MNAHRARAAMKMWIPTDLLVAQIDLRQIFLLHIRNNFGLVFLVSVVCWFLYMAVAVFLVPVFVRFLVDVFPHCLYCIAYGVSGIQRKVIIRVKSTGF